MVINWRMKNTLISHFLKVVNPPITIFVSELRLPGFNSLVFSRASISETTISILVVFSKMVLYAWVIDIFSNSVTLNNVGSYFNLMRTFNANTAGSVLAEPTNASVDCKANRFNHHRSAITHSAPLIIVCTAYVKPAFQLFQGPKI